MGGRVRRTHNLRRKANRLDQGLKVAMKRGMAVIKQLAQEYAPEDTGRMLRGLLIEEPRWRAGRLRCRLGPTVDYAIYTELEKYTSGKHLGRVSEAKGARMPWLRPAFKERKGEAMAIIKASLRVTLRSLATR